MIDSSIEIWKDIPGYEGLYQASNLGNIRSVCQGKRKKAGGYIWRYHDRTTIKIN